MNHTILAGLLGIISLFSFASCATSKVSRKEEKIDKRLKEEPWIADDFKAPKASGPHFSADNAASLARACSLIWEEDKGAIAAVAHKWKLDHLFVDLRATHSQYLLLGNKDFTVLAFRATQGKIGDIGTVLKIVPWETTAEYEDGTYGGLPPGAAGFRESVADCFFGGLVKDIELFRRATDAGTSPLFVTGHSLGGALAVLTRAKLAKEGITADSVYVFGCPVTVSPVGADDYRRDYAPTNFFLRFPGDNVPRLRWKNKNYSPPGNSYEIHRDGTLTDYSTYRTKNTLTSIAWCVPWLVGVVRNHNLRESYLPSIEAAQRRARSD